MSEGEAGRPGRQRFRGRIAGVGSTSGIRVVLGRWVDTPLGEFADAMVETAEGHRVLLAPSEQVRDFIAETYVFDETRVEPFRIGVTGDTWRVRSESLTLELTTGPRKPVGWALRVVPKGLAERPGWSRVTDPIARTVLRGVRTRGTARGGRTEYYGATDVRAVLTLRGSFDGTPLGELAPVDPPCSFGFSSVPTEPSVTDVVTTVDVHG